MVNRLRSINDLFDDFSNYIDDPLGYIGYGHVCFLQKDAPKSAYESYLEYLSYVARHVEMFEGVQRVSLDEILIDENKATTEEQRDQLKILKKLIEDKMMDVSIHRKN